MLYFVAEVLSYNCFEAKSGGLTVVILRTLLLLQVHSITKSKLQEWTPESLELGSAVLSKTSRATYTLLRTMIPLPTLNVVDKFRNSPRFDKESLKEVIRVQMEKIKRKEVDSEESKLLESVIGNKAVVIDSDICIPAEEMSSSHY